MFGHKIMDAFTISIVCLGLQTRVGKLSIVVKQPVSAYHFLCTIGLEENEFSSH